MILSIKDIQKRLEKCAAAVSDKGWKDARAYFHVQSDGRFCCTTSSVNPASWGAAPDAHVFDDTPHKALEKLEAKIAKFEDVSTKKKHDFMNALGCLIDKGNAVGIEVEFLNPLTKTMKELSENILTDQNK